MCAHNCGVDRSAGPRGACHAGPRARFFSAQIEVGDELELVPTFAIALSGCDLRCAFCVTGAESWNGRAGRPLDTRAMAEQATLALTKGARTVMILGGEPTIHLPSVLELVAALPPNAKLVWKTNAHASRQARELLEGLFDLWVADYKFGNDSCAQRLARVPNYSEVVRENLLWAGRHTELIVRHLLMPGHVECCWKAVAEWLAAEMPRTKVSLWLGFWPGWHSHRHRELGRSVAGPESARAREIARNCGLNLIE